MTSEDKNDDYLVVPIQTATNVPFFDAYYQEEEISFADDSIATNPCYSYYTEDQLANLNNQLELVSCFKHSN